MPTRLFPLLALLAACATPAAPAPAAPESCALAISIRTIRPNEASRRFATTIYFVRVDDAGDPIAAEPVIESNHARGRVVYLLDAEPGTYAAVASAEKRDGRTFVNYFPIPLIRKTLTTVAPGGTTYMGTADMEVTRISGKADRAQEHDKPLIDPNFRSKSIAFRIFDGSRMFLGRDFNYRRRDDSLEPDVREHLAAGGWTVQAKASR